MKGEQAKVNGHPPGRKGRPKGKPEPLSDLDSARWALRVAATRDPVPDEIARRLTPEWGEACLLAQDDGAAGLDTWVKVQRSRLRNDPPRFEALSAALDEARAAGPEDPPAVPVPVPDSGRQEPPPFRLKTIDSMTFFARTYDRRWLVRRIAVAGQPCIIGGPKKTLKTSVLVDLIISVASACEFLGMFVVDRPLRVGFFSGESGEATIQETARRICESKGIDPSVLDNIVWGFDLPQLSNEEHLAELARVILENRLEVVIIDPLYLCLLAGPGGKQLDPANLYQMGPVFSAVARTCLEAGATPMLVHHFRKNRESPYEVPELEDLAFAGIQEFARQWILLGRRKKYEPGSGKHELWLTVGGSSGHTGEWALDVEEGTMGDDFGGRRWEVSVRGANDARDEFTRQRDDAKAEQAAERNKVKAEARDREDAELVVRLAVLLRDLFDGRTTQRKLRAASNWDSKKFDRIAIRAELAGWIRSIMVPYQASKTRIEDVPGYELAKDPGVIR